MTLPVGTPAWLHAIWQQLGGVDGAALAMGKGVYAAASFTPAAAAYSAGDVMDVAKEFVFYDRSGAAIPSGSIIRILSTIHKIDITALQASEAAYSLPLYTVTPPSAQADNAAWTLASADLPSYLGTLDLSTPVDAGAALFVKKQLTDQQHFRLSGTSLFGRLVTVAGFTATAVARQVTLIGEVL